MLTKIQLELRKHAKPEKIPIYMNFFKTGKGQYGEGDRFIGVTVPDTRMVAIKFADSSINLKEVLPLLKSKIHEDRMCALFIIVYKFKNAKTQKEKKQYVDFYIKHHLFGNNWDLIDCICDKILGHWLIDKDKSLLYKYAKSSNLWERRIAIITTLHFIRNKQLKDTFKIAKILMQDKHDLIHKAVGWMLREAGKRDQQQLEKFLNKHYKRMPRTMLRYAIERLSEEKKRFYMKR